MSSGPWKLSPFGKSLDENKFFVKRSWQGSFRIWFIWHPWFGFRDQSEFFVTRVWRRFCGTVSDRTAQIYSLDENRPCFRSGGQTGCCSDLAHWVWSAVPSVENFSLHLYELHPKLSVLWVKILLRSARACPCLLREYVRYLIGMIFYFAAHQNSICLSLLYAKFALSMDMTTLISKVTSPAFPIDMTIIIWIHLGLFSDTFI